MEDHVLSPGEAQALLAEAAPTQGQQVQEPPVTIHVKAECHDSGAFIVTDVDAWAYQPLGIFAIGSWRGDAQERELVIPYDWIRYLEIDFAALERYKAAQAAEAFSNQFSEGSDDEPDQGSGD